MHQPPTSDVYFKAARNYCDYDDTAVLQWTGGPQRVLHCRQDFTPYTLEHTKSLNIYIYIFFFKIKARRHNDFNTHTVQTRGAYN